MGRPLFYISGAVTAKGGSHTSSVNKSLIRELPEYRNTLKVLAQQLVLQRLKQLRRASQKLTVGKLPMIAGHAG
ncbi:unnamed protein product [Pleuronectes platessa]|uniref:Uncharacterized protein n=1 Tax=Pleuronectes platessa TaxID=8262 RepID=A0A9N7VJU2_PLEPL|nr:unnamed protein product [Pleuronectes platessa]